MYLKLAVWMGLGFYALLSATDWVMTYALLQMHPGAVEANPLAAACLDQHGWRGLAIYKVGGVVVFFGAIVLMIPRRPAVAAVVVTGACALLLSVTVYTHGLICAAHREKVEREEDVAWPKSALRDVTDSSAPDHCWFAPDQPAPRPVVRRTASLK